LLKEEIEKNARLEFVDQEWKNTPEGRLFFTIQGAFSEYEREKIRERMTRGKLEKTKMDGLPTCCDTYGYRQENGKLIEDPVEAFPGSADFPPVLEIAGEGSVGSR